MATEGSLKDLLEEATCSICLDFFQDPVLILECGHNFCRGCLTRSWGASESEASCPQCRQSFAPRSLFANRHLARMAEVTRRCGGHLVEEGGSFCPKHREPLKLFCKDHQTLICVVCDRSKEHRGHSVIPAEEAFQEYQVKLEDCLKAQKEQKEKVATYKRETEKKLEEKLDCIKEERKNVVAEFRELQQWLEGQEKLLLSEMEEAEKEIMARKEKGLAKHTEDLCSLDHLIQEIEEKLQQPASKLLQDIGGLLNKYQAKETYENPVDLPEDPKWNIGNYSDITVFLKSAMKKFRDTLESGRPLHEVNVTLDPKTTHLKSIDISEDQKSVPYSMTFYNPPYVLGYPTAQVLDGYGLLNVTLDPDTAHPHWLNISKDRKKVKGLKPMKEMNAVANSKIFVYNPYVLGCQRFSSGKHFWEVIVGDRGGWGVGVANKSLNLTDIDEQTRRWQIGKWGGKYKAISPSRRSDLVLIEEPTRIRVSQLRKGTSELF